MLQVGNAVLVGLDSTARLMEELGCPNTKLHSKTFRRDTSIFPQRSQEFGLGSTAASISWETQVKCNRIVSRVRSGRRRSADDAANSDRQKRHVQNAERLATVLEFGD